MAENKVSKWQRELISFSGIKSTFIIEGNINDLYPSALSDGEFNSLNETIAEIFAKSEKPYDSLFCDPLFTFSDPLGENKTAEMAKKYSDIAKQQRSETEVFEGNSLPSDTIVRASEIVRAALTKPDTRSNPLPIVAIVNFASRLVSLPDRLSPTETTLFLNLFYASKNAVRIDGSINTLILIVDKVNDLPAWFYLNNPNVRIITIPNPDRESRSEFITQCFSDLNANDDTTHRIKEKFTDITEGMKLLELDELRRLYQRSNTEVSDVLDTVAIYKFGFKDNKWAAIRERIQGDIQSKIRVRVKGQEQALQSISQIIKRSVIGLSGLQHSSGDSKPRGILFLAGPTGTGKTEVVKTVAELLFGDEKALIRFDMSEYTAEHSDQKLFGAPPGYVGYDQGGQLTNAVKANPFSVLLFDEIEKAHPTIMDKFLQILEDGRMTDGQGNTVYFSETLIFFTSNAGITKETYDYSGRVIQRELVIKPGMPYNEMQSSVEAALKTKFKPEVINRIGKNIIVFDYITEKASAEILRLQIDNILAGIERKNRITTEFNNEAFKYLLSKCLEDEARQSGGRGIGNVVESLFINPLAEYMFDNSIKQGETIEMSCTDNQLTFGRKKEND
jgi:ATP-dependent Clp protease ATP-binding subunit ClpA